MSYLERKYVNLLSTSLRNFKRKSGNLYSFSCPYCGDSLKNPRKARGYVYNIGDKLAYKCHNCGLSTSVPNLIKHVNPMLYEEFVKELLLEKYQPKKDRVEEFSKQVKKSAPEFSLNKLQKVSDLPANHRCKQYVLRRQIPLLHHSRLFYIPKFMEWTNELLPDKFDKDALKHDDERLVIPLIGKDKKVFGYQGRSLKDDAEIRYISIILDESYPKIFGMDRADESRRFYVLEGPIDSMFIENAVACAGSELLQVASYLNKKNAVLVFDNEPRSKETCKKMQRAINLDYKICIWPTSITEKDINAMVLNHCAPSFVKQLLDERIFQGLEAQIVFSEWRKI